LKEKKREIVFGRKCHYCLTIFIDSVDISTRKPIRDLALLLLLNGAGVIKIVKLKLRFSSFCSRKEKSQPFPYGIGWLALS
jgi:hypothetical protein